MDCISVQFVNQSINQSSESPDSNKHKLKDGGHDRASPFSDTRDDETTMRPFVKLLWTLIIIIIIIIMGHETMSRKHTPVKHANNRPPTSP